ncbi:MAG: hypothetical protein ABI685_05525 [Ferruginibacter sp.]
MKKNLIITLALGLFLFNSTNGNIRPEARSGKTTVTKNLSARLLMPDLECVSYSIYNPHGPLGVSVMYTYMDCDGISQEGYLDPQETVFVLAQPGTVKCPGGEVTESQTRPKSVSGQSMQ